MCVHLCHVIVFDSKDTSLMSLSCKLLLFLVTGINWNSSQFYQVLLTGVKNSSAPFHNQACVTANHSRFDQIRKKKRQKLNCYYINKICFGTDILMISRGLVSFECRIMYLRSDLISVLNMISYVGDYLRSMNISCSCTTSHATNTCGDIKHQYTVRSCSRRLLLVCTAVPRITTVPVSKRLV